MNCSETAFISLPEEDDHDVRIRFFTPTTEVPLCGHATIAAIYVYAKKAIAKASRVLQKTDAGWQKALDAREMAIKVMESLKRR